MDDIEGIENIKAWLYTIATNLYRDHLRRKKVRHTFLESRRNGQPEIDDIGTRSNVDPVEDSQRREDVEAVLGAMDRLPVKMRQVFILREIEGLSYDEIGDLLKMASGTAKSRMHRAIKQMRQDLASRFEFSNICLGEIT
jgi:RNA polymerase sigma-70 factor (ECF subfamily)